MAAVVALVQARAAATSGSADGPHPTEQWADPAHNVPRPVPGPGPGAWRTSFWPR
nr:MULTISPECIES: acyl-CoA carboxylase epsilon subunit [unclassified Streptomyces]